MIIKIQNNSSPPGSPKDGSSANLNALTGFPYKLKFERNERHLSQTQLATKSGVSRRMIQKYEAGQCFPSTRTLASLARALNITPAYLLSNDEPSQMVKESEAPYGQTRQEIFEKGFGWFFDQVNAIFDELEIDRKKPENLLLFHRIMELYRHITRRR